MTDLKECEQCGAKVNVLHDIEDIKACWDCFIKIVDAQMDEHPNNHFPQEDKD